MEEWNEEFKVEWKSTFKYKALDRELDVFLGPYTRHFFHIYLRD